MKKTIGALLVLSLVLLAGCGAKQSNAAAQAEQDTTAATGGGLEDSIFSDDSATTSQQDQSSTTPTETPTNSDNAISTGDSGTLNQEFLSLDYESFRALTPAKQQEYQESFADIDAFFEWYNAARDAYHNANPPTEIDGSGTVTLP